MNGSTELPEPSTGYDITGSDPGTISGTIGAPDANLRALVDAWPVLSDAAISGHIAAALSMIERLPLSDAEKAEAVRRLLAGGSDDA